LRSAALSNRFRGLRFTSLIMSNYNFREILIVLSLAGASVLQAETLEQLTGEALRNNPQFRVLQASVESANGGVRTARAWQNPELSVAPGVRQHREGATETIFHGELELNQLFLFPGKRQLLIAIAQRNVEISKLALEGLRFQLTTAVRKAFYEMLAAQQIAAFRTEQIESAKTFYEAAVKRAEGGYASDFEAVKGQAELIDAQKLARAAEGQIASARVELNTLLGRNPSSPLMLKGSLQNAAPRGPTGNFVTLAMTRNPSLRTQEMQAQLAGLNLRKTRLGRRPDFALGPRVEYTDREQTYGFGATVALPLWNQSQGEIQTARAQEEKEIAAAEKLRAEIAGAVTKASATLAVAREQLALYTPAFLDKLKAFVNQAEKSYAQNATTVLIYLDAKRTYFDALTSYYETLGHVAASHAELESAIGVPVDPETFESQKSNR
jgi:outer membrane protein, heavy metal efflux system